MAEDPQQIADAFRAKVAARAKDYAERAAFMQALYIERFMDERGPDPGTRSTSQRIGARKGGISRSLTPRQPGNVTEYKVETGSITLTTGIDSNMVPYALIQEHGGTIVPKSAKALTVPVSPEAAQMLEAAGGNIRSLNLFVLRGKDPNHAALARQDGDRVTVLFALLKSVTLPARPYYAPGMAAFEAEGVPKLNQEFSDGIAEDYNNL